MKQLLTCLLVVGALAFTAVPASAFPVPPPDGQWHKIWRGQGTHTYMEAGFGPGCGVGGSCNAWDILFVNNARYPIHYRCRWHEGSVIIHARGTVSAESFDVVRRARTTAPSFAACFLWTIGPSARALTAVPATATTKTVWEDSVVKLIAVVHPATNGCFYGDTPCVVLVLKNKTGNQYPLMYYCTFTLGVHHHHYRFHIANPFGTSEREAYGDWSQVFPTHVSCTREL